MLPLEMSGFLASGGWRQARRSWCHGNANSSHRRGTWVPAGTCMAAHTHTPPVHTASLFSLPFFNPGKRASKQENKRAHTHSLTRAQFSHDPGISFQLTTNSHEPKS
jgi:hypothetical protein